MKTILITTTLLAILPLAANANPDGKKPHRPLGPPKAILEKFDTDGDGKLSDEEAKAARAAMQEKRAAIVAKFDKDGDGELNDEEREAAKEELKALHGDREMPHRPARARILKRFDKDGDGKLNEEEREAAKGALKQWREKNGGQGGEPAAE